jgi:hypothetical protein
VVVVAASAATAADYPYSGLFATSDTDASLQEAQLHCAYSFFAQNKDGSYVSYHLDLQHYLADRTIRFVEYSRGNCTPEADGKVETCTSTFDTDPAEQGKSYTDVFRDDGSGIVHVSFFDRIDDARSFAATGAGKPDFEVRYSLCPDSGELAKYLSTDRSTLSPADRLQVTAPVPDDATAAIMTSVLKTIHNSDTP